MKHAIAGFVVPTVDRCRRVGHIAFSRRPARNNTQRACTQQPHLDRTRFHDRVNEFAANLLLLRIEFSIVTNANRHSRKPAGSRRAGIGNHRLGALFTLGQNFVTQFKRVDHFQQRGLALPTHRHFPIAEDALAIRGSLKRPRANAPVAKLRRNVAIRRVIRRNGGLLVGLPDQLRQLHQVRFGDLVPDRFEAFPNCVSHAAFSLKARSAENWAPGGGPAPLSPTLSAQHPASYSIFNSIEPA